MNYTIRTAAAVASIVTGLASTAIFAQSPSEEITSGAVIAQIGKDAALRSDALHVETIGDTAYLSGQVDTYGESQDAVQAARQIPQVKKVVNNLSYGSN